jgi:ATP-NAD kinase N-terminal domain
MTITIGIIANPASGKDIRRLVAYGSSFDNNEKVNIVRRVLLAVDAIGVESVFYMPDTFGIVARAAAGATLRLDLRELAMPVLGNAGDSLEAARRMRDLGVGCIVTLGGDGTNRIVARGCGNVPLVPISTGTNNVFPFLIESTLAGLAAATVATLACPGCVQHASKLELTINGVDSDIALIDVVRSNQRWIGTRAFWDAEHLCEAVTSIISPAAIGMCGLGGMLFPDPTDADHGVHIEFDKRGRRYAMPLGPGLIHEIGVGRAKLLPAGSEVTLQLGCGTIALDGERELEIGDQDSVVVRLRKDGPIVVNVDAALKEAARAGLFNR